MVQHGFQTKDVGRSSPKLDDYYIRHKKNAGLNVQTASFPGGSCCHKYIGIEASLTISSLFWEQFS